jgi:integrase
MVYENLRGMKSIARSYCDERTVTPDYRQALIRVAQSLDGAGINPMTLTDSLMNRWLATLPQSPTTRSNYRRMALTLWRYAADRKLSRHYPVAVTKVKPRYSPVIAWSQDELRRLIKTASEYHHTLKTGASAGVFFEGWTRCAYETGLRFSDQLRLDCSAIREDRLYVVMNKTGLPVSKRITPRLVEILTMLSVRGDGRTFFLAHLSERWIRIHFARICKEAGLSGTPKWLRRTGATFVEAKQPGMAGRFLGHLSHGLAEKHYIDRTLLPDACPVPPEI